MEWVLVIIILGSSPLVADFETKYACREAAKTVMIDYPDEGAAKFYCFSKKA